MMMDDKGHLLERTVTKVNYWGPLFGLSLHMVVVCNINVRENRRSHQ